MKVLLMKYTEIGLCSALNGYLPAKFSKLHSCSALFWYSAADFCNKRSISLEKFRRTLYCKFHLNTQYFQNWSKNACRLDQISHATDAVTTY